MLQDKVLKVLEIENHAISLSNGLISIMKLSTLIEDANLKQLQIDAETWSLYFDVQMDEIKRLHLKSDDTVPIHLLRSLNEAIEKTDHLMYDNVKRMLNKVVFAQKKF